MLNAQVTKLPTRMNPMPAINDRLLSVVMECNTEHQDPSRKTNQDSSENAFSVLNNGDQRHQIAAFGANSDEAIKQLINNQGQTTAGQPGLHPKNQMAIDNDFNEELANKNNGDDTPEEKLKYARLQTEGYQDDGYQDSEDEEGAIEIPIGSENQKYEYGPEDCESGLYEDQEADQMVREDNGIQAAQGQGQAESEQMVDLNNYKGIYFEDDNEKFQCPDTGAHFKFEDLCGRMERIRIKRGDPLVEFDERGNKIYVTSVALASKSGRGSHRKDSVDNRSAQKAIEKRQKPNESSTNKRKSKVTNAAPQPANKQNNEPQQMQFSQDAQQEALMQAAAGILQMNSAGDASSQNQNAAAAYERNGSQTVKITGSILAQHEANTQALQASRNAKMSGFNQQVQHQDYTEESHEGFNQFASKDIVNVLGVTEKKESRNKNRIQNPQVTKNSLQGGTLEKLLASSKKIQQSTLMQPLGRNSHLSAMINPSQVKSQSSLLESANKRDPKSKLFGGKKNQQFSLSKKASGISHTELMTASQPRQKKSQGHQHSILSGNQTISSNWTQSVFDQQQQNMMSKTHLSSGAPVYQNSKMSFQQQRQNQLSTKTNRQAQQQIFETLKAEHSAARRQEATSLQKGIKVKGPQNLRNSNLQLVDRNSVDPQKAGAQSKAKGILKSNKLATDSNQHISIHESRVKKATHTRKVNTLQDNMQFIKDLQKTKSLKHLQQNADNDSQQVQHHNIGMSKKSNANSKSQADVLKSLGAKTMGAGQFNNISNKMFMMQQQPNIVAANKKNLGKTDNISSKFLAGVKGTHQQSMALHQNNPMLQTMKVTHSSLYGNSGPSAKKGQDQNNSRKLVKSTSHLQIGQNGGCGSDAANKIQKINGGQKTSVNSQRDIQVLQNPATLKQMHKNMSVTQLNQPHLQSSFLNNIQASSNHTMQDIVQNENAQMQLEPRPDSKMSNHNRHAQSLSQGKTLTAASMAAQQQVQLQKTLASTKQSRKKQQYLQMAQMKNIQQQALPIASSFVVNGASQSLTQRIANSKMISNQNTASHNYEQTATKKSRKGTEMILLANDSLMHSAQSKMDSHRSQGHHRSNTNLVQPPKSLQQINNLQQTASALLQNLNDKNSLQNYQKSVNQMKSSLLTNQKDGMPTKSRNPANQVSLSQKQGQAIMQTMPNNLNPLQTSSQTDLGMGANSAVTLMFNQQPAAKRATAKSKDGTSKIGQQKSIISPNQATVKRLKPQSQNPNQLPKEQTTARSLYLGAQQPKQRVVKRGTNLVAGASGAQPAAVRKSPSIGADKQQKNSTSQAAQQLALNYGLSSLAGQGKKQSASSGNLFMQTQTQMHNLKLQEQQQSAQNFKPTSASPHKQDGSTRVASNGTLLQNLVLPGKQLTQGAPSVIQGQGTARSQRLSLKVEQIQH